MENTFKLLIVDDELLARKRILSFDLEKHGFLVVGEAENGKDALDMVAELSPDIVVIDIIMPVMSGLEFIEELQKYPNPPKVILLTCYDEFSKVQAALRLGAQDYLVKILLREEEFVEALNKVTRVILKERQMLRKSIRKVLNDFILSPFTIDSNEYIKQLSELGFMPKYYSVRLLEFSSSFINNLEAYKLSLENWDDSFGCVITNISVSQCTLFLYTVNASKMHEFQSKVSSFCRDINKLFENVESAVKPGFHIFLGLTNSCLSRLNEAFIRVTKLKEQIFYIEDQNLITEESSKFIFTDMPEDEFQETITKVRYGCNSQNGEVIANALILWLEAIEQKYKPMPSEVKIMGVLISACLPQGLCTYKENSTYSLRQWLREKIEQAHSISNIHATIHYTAEQLKRYLGNEVCQVRSEIKQAIEFIRSNYNRDIDLEMAANHVKLSSSWFGNLFRSEMGQSFSEYLTAYRLKVAQQLLENTEMRISQISAEVGIGDPQYFSRVFSKAMGQNPTEYRLNQTSKINLSDICRPKTHLL